MNNRQVHFTSYWHPDPQFEVLAPRGIKLWAQVLRELYSKGLREKDLFTWFGKISISPREGGKPRLGKGFQTNKEISDLNNIIKEQSETHLYMWTYKHDNVEASLHVGKVVEISEFQTKFLSSSYQHVPVEFYKSMAQRNPHKKSRDLFPVWFKLEDIRKIPFDNYNKLSLIETGEAFIADSENTLSPRQVFQDNSSIPGLSEEELHQNEWKGWWEQTLLDDVWDPGQFNSPKLKEIYAEALRFSRVNVPILILGERGVGKTFLAWWIRMQSSFKGGGRTKNFEWEETRQRRKPGRVAKRPEPTKDPIEKDRQKWPQMACGSFADENSLRSD